MAWKIDWEDKARKDLKSLDYPIQKKIVNYLRKRVTDNPRSYGKELGGNKAGLWRYRWDDFRIICQIQDENIRVLVVRVGHRKNIYD